MKCLREVTDHPSLLFMLMNSSISKRDNPSYRVNMDEFQIQASDKWRGRSRMWEDRDREIPGVAHWGWGSPISELPLLLVCERWNTEAILYLFKFFFLNEKEIFRKWHGDIDLQCFILLASKNGMGACQYDRKCLVILSFLKLGFDTNPFHARQIWLIDSVFAPRQLSVWWNKTKQNKKTWDL